MARRGARTEGPGVQLRTTDVAANVVSAVAKQERRSMKDQAEILILAGATALGYDLETLDLNASPQRG